MRVYVEILKDSRFGDKLIGSCTVPFPIQHKVYALTDEDDEEITETLELMAMDSLHAKITLLMKQVPDVETLRGVIKELQEYKDNKEDSESD